MSQQEAKGAQISTIAAEVRSLLASNQIDLAEEVLAKGRDSSPNHLGLMLLEGSILEKRGDMKGAQGHFTQLAQDFEDNPKPYYQLACLAVLNQDYSEGARHLQIAEEKGLPSERVLHLCLKIAKNNPDLVSSRKMLEKFPQSPEAMLWHARICVKLKDFEATLSSADKVLATSSDSTFALALVAKAAVKLGDAERAESAYSTLMGLEPEATHWVISKMDLYILMGENGKALDLLSDAMDRGMTSKMLFSKIQRLRIPKKMLIRIAQILKMQIEESMLTSSAIATHINATSDVPMQSDVELKDLPPDTDLKRSIVSDDLDTEVLIAEAKAPDAVLLVFTGFDRALLSVDVLDRYPASMNLTTVYLRDSNRMLFGEGLMSVPGKFEGAVEYLRKIIAHSGTNRLITIGTSAGGYAALRYGLALGAETIIGFSAPTNLTEQFLANDGRGKIIARRLQSLSPEAKDSMPAVQESGGRTAIHLVFGENSKEDSMHANYLRGAPGVTLHALPDVEKHATLRFLAEEGKLRDFLNTHIKPGGGDVS